MPDRSLIKQEICQYYSGRIRRGLLEKLELQGDLKNNELT
jgi:hypothetical protein